MNKLLIYFIKFDDIPIFECCTNRILNIIITNNTDQDR